MSIPDFTCWFVRGKGLFGAYPPSPSRIDEIQSCLGKDTLFINLTEYGENKDLGWYDYSDMVKNYLSYEVKDHTVPREFIAYTTLIDSAYTHMKQGGKVYVHCWGGHGRAGTFVACYLCRHEGLTAEQSLKKTFNLHQQRVNIPDKWREIGCPENQSQKQFVADFYKMCVRKRNN